MFAARFRRLTIPVALLTSVVVFAGGCCCFTTIYDTGVYSTWHELEHGLNAQPPAPTKLSENAPTLEEQTGVTIRLPALFNYKAVGLPLTRNAARSGEPVEPERIQPPGLDLPGYYITYEMYYSDGKGMDLPVYCYLGVLPKGESKEAKEAILKQLEGEYPDAEWTDKTLKDTSGEGTFEMVPGLSVTGPQSFYPKSQTKAIETPGRMDIYVVPRDHATVVVAWRAPQDIAKRISFFEAAQSSVASIKSEKPAEPIVAAAPPGDGQPTGQHVQFPNAEVEIIPPVGFHKSARINGFQKEGSNTQITILPQQVSAKSLIQGYNDAYFTSNKLFVAAREEIAGGDAPAVLWLVERQGSGRFWQYVFGDDTQSFILTGELTELDEATKAAVRSSLLTARMKNARAQTSLTPNSPAAGAEIKNGMKQMVIACLEHHTMLQKGPSDWDEFIAWAEKNKPDVVSTLRELRAAGVVFFCNQELRKATVGSSNSIFAYYGTVPQNGGVVSFLDGVVVDLTAEEFGKKLAMQRQFSPDNVAKKTN